MRLVRREVCKGGGVFIGGAKDANLVSKSVSGTVVGLVPEETVWLPAFIISISEIKAERFGGKSSIMAVLDSHHAAIETPTVDIRISTGTLFHSQPVGMRMAM